MYLKLSLSCTTKTCPLTVNTTLFTQIISKLDRYKSNKIVVKNLTNRITNLIVRIIFVSIHFGQFSNSSSFRNTSNDLRFATGNLNYHRLNKASSKPSISYKIKIIHALFKEYYFEMLQSSG